MPETQTLVLSEIAKFGQLNEREQSMVKVAAKQGHDHGWKIATKSAKDQLPEVLTAFVKALDAPAVKRLAPELWKSVLKQGWDLAIAKRAAGTKGVAGLLSLPEVIELAKMLRGPELNIDLPDSPAIAIHNHPADVVVKYEEE